jgi:hypothetical protein
MAVIKNIRNAIDLNSLFEDPTPGSNYLYFQSDAYTKDTLAPLYDIGMTYTSNGSIINNTFGYSGVSQAGTIPYDYRIGGILQLNGETTHVRHNLFKTADDYRNNLDISPFVSMDTNYRVKPVQYFTDGTNNVVISSFNYNNGTVVTTSAVLGHFAAYWIKLNTNAKDLYTSGYVTNKQNTSGQQGTQPAASFAYYASANNNQYGTNAWPVYRNPASNNVVWIAQAYYGSYTPGAVIGASQVTAFSASPTMQGPASGVNQNYSGQMVGVSKLDFNTINIHHAILADGSNNIYKYQDSSNSYTTLNTFSFPTSAGSGSTGTYNLSTATIMAGLNFTTATWVFSFTATNFVSTFTGTATVFGSVLTVTGVTTGTLAIGMTITQIAVNLSSGTTLGATLANGAPYTGTSILSFGQGTNQGGDRGISFGNRLPKFASKTFTDLSTASTMGFYVPYVDRTGGFHPLYYRWNQLTDNFTRVTDITMIYPGTSQGAIWTNDTFSLSSIDINYGMQRAWYTETFVSSGTRYLMLMQLHGAGGLFDSSPSMRTFPVYSINTSTYKTLTYSSKLEVPATPKNIVWLNDDRTILGIFCHANFYVYTFTSGAGWTQTGNFPFQFNAAGRDNMGRIWAQDTGLGWGRIHLLTLNVPISIVVTSDATSYNYAGTAVTANVTVNAYNYNGSRIATSVKLVIDGGAMTFAGSNLTLTITTSASADTVVPVTITGGGVANIIASAALS